MVPELEHPQGIIHDIRNLLMVISINSTLLNEQQISAEQRSLVTGIAQAARYLGSLMKDLQSISRSPQATEESNVHQTLKQAADFVRSMHPEVKVNVPQENAGIALPIEQTRLLRCLMNLTVNAAEAALANEATQPVVHLEAAETNDNVVIRVTDSGRGFQNSAQESFAPFVSTRTDEPNRGLGLFIVQSIVESSGGQLRVARTKSQTEMSIEFLNCAALSSN